MTHTFFATAPKGLTKLLAAELRELGATDTHPAAAGVKFQATLATAYKACMWSRLANRILLQVAQAEASNESELYDLALTIPWRDHLAPQRSFAIDYTGKGDSFRHSQYCALKIKDAVADYFRQSTGQRPSVDTTRPDVRISAFARGSSVTLYVDLAGKSLHQRGYRSTGGPAPLKENLAAAIAISARWPRIAEQGGAFLDPMCGSGTLIIEAALLAADRAPGLLRQWWGFLGWLGHQESTWTQIVEEADSRAMEGAGKVPPMYAADVDPMAVRLAADNAQRAGVAQHISFEQRSLVQWKAAPAEHGLVAVNPPYGERLSDNHRLTPLYAQLGSLLQQQLRHWRYAVFCADTAPIQALGLKPVWRGQFFNGPIPCTLLCGGAESPSVATTTEPGEPRDTATSQAAEMLGNRLRKNIKEARRWAEKHGVRCYRVYDADMPEFSFAIDIYQGEDRWLHVQEYAPPSSVDDSKAALRRQVALAVVPEAFGILPENVFFKLRRRQRQGTQYEKFGEENRFFAVDEGPAKFWVNFSDYLDTGLFLDHRPTRAMVLELAKHKHFLNLFAYTGSVSVYAALGGAASTTSVDMSTTYQDWTQRNFTLNGIRGRQHALVRADCLQWLEQAGRERKRFDLIFLDPPTFSRSKRMEQDFDIQRDHEQLLEATMALLQPAGLLIFSNNAQRFKLAPTVEASWEVEDISRATIPWDFRRNPKIHQCWKIRHRA